MYHVNFSNPNATRVPKTSVRVFSEIIKARVLPAEYLQITGEISGNVTNKRTSEHMPTTSPSSAAGCKEINFKYLGILVYIWLVTVTCSGNIFTP
jgi:hypothetical protein